MKRLEGVLWLMLVRFAARSISLLGTVSAATAGWFDAWGIYHCIWVAPPFGWVCQ